MNNRRSETLLNTLLKESASVAALNGGRNGYQVELGDKVLAKFDNGERTNAMDFANGFNAGLAYAKVNKLQILTLEICCSVLAERARSFGLIVKVLGTMVHPLWMLLVVLRGALDSRANTTTRQT